MKSVRMIGAALALSGFFAVPASAQQGYAPSYQTTRFTQPGVLPGTQYPQYGVQQTTGYALTARRLEDNGPENGTTPSVAPGATQPESVVTPQPNQQVQAGPTLSGPALGGPGCGCNNGGVVGNGQYFGAMNDAVSSGGCGEDYGCGLPACSWTAYIGGLYMGRDSANKKWTTYETGNNPNQLMYYPDADWTGGAEIRVGKYLGCGCDTMLEGVYYGVYGLDATDSRYSPTNQLSTPIDTGLVNYVAPGQPAVGFFDNAREHRVSRSGDFHNVEINLIRYIAGCGQCNTCQPLSIGLVSGFRFIRFDDNLLFTSSSAGNDIGTNPAQEANFTSDVSNTLYGYQIGAIINRQCSQNWSIFARPMVGIYGNHVEFNTHGYRGDGQTATFATTGNAFNLSNDKDDVALVGQLDIGLNYKAGQHWTLTAGYRVIGFAGIALADDQVPAYLAAENDWTDIESSGSMILHGFFGGVTYAW